jgi:hypothetical protein
MSVVLEVEGLLEASIFLVLSAEWLLVLWRCPVLSFLRMGRVLSFLGISSRLARSLESLAFVGRSPARFPA